MSTNNVNRDKTTYKSRMFNFLVRIRTACISGKAMDVHTICKQVGIGNQMPTVLWQNKIIRKDETQRNLFHWENGSAVDAKLVDKVIEMSRKYSKTKAALRAKNRAAMAAAEQQQLQLPVTDKPWNVKTEIEFIEEQLDEQSKMLKLIIDRFGLNGNGK